MLHIALAKGRIARKVMKSLSDGGYQFPDYSDDSRKLIFTDKEGRIRVTLVKSPDVAVYVRRGAADAGIVGKDVLMEDGEEDVYEILDLGIGKCRMAVSGIKGKRDVCDDRNLCGRGRVPGGVHCGAGGQSPRRRRNAAVRYQPCASFGREPDSVCRGGRGRG